MNKTVMFIGAGEYQLPGIKMAKGMGLRVVAVDKNPQAPGFKFADIPVTLDIRDVNGCIKIASQNNIDGVLTIASDIAVPTVAAVGNTLRLPTISTKAAKISTNKILMREIFAKNGLPSPKFESATSLSESIEACNKIGFPVVIKPSDNAGSRGVSMIENSDGIEMAFNHAINNSREGDVIIEEFMDGTECTIEGMTHQGKTEILAISQKKKVDGSYRVATDLTYPPDFPLETISEIEKVIKSAIAVMGINMGPTHSEVIVTQDGPKIVEVAARGGGFGVFSKIISLACGVDAVTETIKMSLGLTPDIKPKFHRGVTLRFFAPKPGKLKKIFGLDEVKLMSNSEVGLYKQVGDNISPLATDGDRTGYIITYGENRGDAIKLADLIESKVKFEIGESRESNREKDITKCPVT